MDEKIFEIKKYPDSVLRKKCVAIEEVGTREQELLAGMVLTMRAFAGIGLAAPQIGISRRLIVADIGDGVIKLANPEIVMVKGRDKRAEGCLSVPALEADIERSYEIIVKGLNEEGREREIKARGLLAKVLQHEIDHINGKLIIDYLSLLGKLRLKTKKK